MKHDPFYQLILDGLRKPLDPDVFERCASDLLRAEWPTLVPVRGGADSGMDGAIADGEGPPLPLVCTTAKNVIANLTRSLTSYIDGGGSRRKLILATSRELSQLRRQNLHVRARDKGCELIQVYDQAAIADRLYRNPPWCRELLQLTGNPSALSVIPLSQRPLLETPLIGRADDLTWLCEATGEGLLMGVPGSGKTFLLQILAKEDEGLFVVSEDRGAIAAALRAQQPKRLIIDDAHLCPELLVSLRQLRTEVGASFTIIASCWPGEQGGVLEALQVPQSAARELGLLTRDEIVKVVGAAGIRKPPLVREIVDQAAGRPGLAVTLAHLCLQGGISEVALGTALGRSLRNTFAPRVGEEAMEILATLSLGGETGMPATTVSNLLDLPPLHVRRQVIRLAAGGVIREVGPPFDLAVHPPVLRHALVRDVFLTGPARLPLETFLPYVPDTDQATSTLIGARARGGAVSDDLLQGLLEQAQSPRLWTEYAWLGAPEATYVLTHHPEVAGEVAEAALHFTPERVIPLLLQAAVSDQRPLHPFPDHPLRYIEHWIDGTLPGTERAISRRRALVHSVSQWLQSGGDPEVGVCALKSALSPQFEITTTDPGAGMTLRIVNGLLTPPEVEELASVWQEATEITQRASIPHLIHLLPVVRDLVYPERGVAGDVPVELHQAARGVARIIVRDLARMADRQPGLIRRLQPYAEALHFELDQTTDTDFAVLYPPERTMSREEDEKQATEARCLAASWADHSPSEIADRLLFIEEQATAADLRWPRWTPLACAELAQKVSSPCQWARAVIDTGLSAELLAPFLQRCAQVREKGWEELLLSCLAQPLLQRCAAWVVLSLPDPPAGLLEVILPLLPSMSDLVEHQTLKGEISRPVISALLAHEAPKVAGAAARGLWFQGPRGEIPEELQSLWRQAVVRDDRDDPLQSEILKQDATLSTEWLEGYLARNRQLFRVSQAVADIIDAVPVEARAALLTYVPDSPFNDAVIKALVGDSVPVYQALLEAKHLCSYHLAPLAQIGQTGWPDMVILALTAGHSQADIAAATLLSACTFSGDESEMWQRRIDQLRLWLPHGDTRVRHVVESAIQLATEARDRAREREHQQRVYGEF
jgi:hypothetical protein